MSTDEKEVSTGAEAGAVGARPARIITVEDDGTLDLDSIASGYTPSVRIGGVKYSLKAATNDLVQAYNDAVASNDVVRVGKTTIRFALELLEAPRDVILKLNPEQFFAIRQQAMSISAAVQMVIEEMEKKDG